MTSGSLGSIMVFALPSCSTTSTPPLLLLGTSRGASLLSRSSLLLTAFLPRGPLRNPLLLLQRLELLQQVLDFLAQGLARLVPRRVVRGRRDLLRGLDVRLDLPEHVPGDGLVGVR
jgi:hypothetical protein